MASKYSNSEKKIRRALAALDTAVQEWYAEHNPENKNHYASVHIGDYEDGIHASHVTLQTDVAGENYKDIYSSKCSKELQA
jgi:hypothetical protein